jgi:hypothetical protein
MQSHFSLLSARAAIAAICAFAAVAQAAPASLDVNPVFPAYGQGVSLQLSSAGPAPYLPATRYQVKGSSITLELEYVAGGYFGWPTNIGYTPVEVGELAPGAYAVQARLYDIGSPTAPPLIFTRAFDVAPPDKSGAYAVPRNPGAYERVRVVVVADGSIDASSLRATVNGFAIRVDFDFSSDPSTRPYASVEVPGLMPGNYRVEAYGGHKNVMASPQRYDGSFTVDMTTTVVEYYSVGLDHYFISASPDEVALVDADGAFKRTGQGFKAWLRATDGPAAAVPVCRFYASGPNSHFYTADPAECQFLKSLEQKQKAEAAAKGQFFGGWQFEGVAFYALAPVNGACDAGARAIYRAYNNRAAQNDSNHRFIAQEGLAVGLPTGWAAEGVAFCSPL